MLGPLNRWYADAHPQSGAGGPAPSTLPRSSGFSALQSKAAVLLGAKAQVNTSAEWQVKVAAAAFEVGMFFLTRGPRVVHAQASILCRTMFLHMLTPYQKLSYFQEAQPYYSCQP